MATCLPQVRAEQYISVTTTIVSREGYEIASAVALYEIAVIILVSLLFVNALTVVRNS